MYKIILSESIKENLLEIAKNVYPSDDLTHFDFDKFVEVLNSLPEKDVVALGKVYGIYDCDINEYFSDEKEVQKVCSLAFMKLKHPVRKSKLFQTEE